MDGKLIIIESGSDGSGKATQTKILYDRLLSEGYNVRKIEFPNYKSDSSALVKMYLRGEFGDNPEDVDAYVASTFYAGDRFASYKTDWEKFYKSGGIVLADRYTTSNMVHQASKMNEDEREKYLDWLVDFEFNLYKIPKPNGVLFLDVPVDVSEKLIRDRKNKINGEDKKDIHESNKEYLEKSYNNSLYVLEKYDWTRINCVSNGNMKSIEEISEEIYSNAIEIIEG